MLIIQTIIENWHTDKNSFSFALIFLHLFNAKLLLLSISCRSLLFILDREYLHCTKNIFIIVKTKIEINNTDISILNYVPPYTMLKLNLVYIITYTLYTSDHKL